MRKWSAGMHMFVLVLLAVAVFYPLARQPSLRPFAFCVMMLAYTGMGAAWWSEHDCSLNAPPDGHWNFASLVRAPHEVTCKGDLRPQFATLILTTTH